MSVVAAAVIGSAAVGVYSANQAGKAAERAANQQADAADAGIVEQQRQFDAIQELLKPYVTAGTGALTGQQNLIGLNGAGPQQQAIDELRASPQFTSMLQQGESSILANASATGGLRGGNVQGALAQFSPALLAASINDRYGQLGGLSSMGLGAATQTGAFGQASTNNVTQLLGQVGAVQAGGALADGRAAAGYSNAINGAIGLYGGLGGFKTATPTAIAGGGLRNELASYGVF